MQNWISWNVNGIRSVMKKDFLGWLKNAQPDALFLQEVRADLSDIPRLELESLGYKSDWNIAEKKGYSGTGFLSKVAPDQVVNGLGMPEMDAEGRVQQVYFGKTIVFNVYFPNGSASDERLEYKLKFNDLLLEVAKNHVANGFHVVICGDYNICHNEIDIARPKDNAKRSGFLPIERKWMDSLCDAGFKDTFRTLYPETKEAYSWWSNRGGARERNVGWRIDYFFCNEALMGQVKGAQILSDVLGSDHCPVSVQIEI